MDLTEMLTRLRIYVDDRNSDRWPGLTELTAFLNVAQQNIQAIIDDADELLFMACKRYDVDPTEDSWEFTLPTDFKRTILLEREVTNGDPIPVEWVDFRSRHEQINTNASPTLSPGRPKCYMRGKKFGVIDPATDYVLRLWYIKRLPDLSGTDTSEIPVEWHDLICLEAAKIALGSVDRQFPVELKDQRDNALKMLVTNMEDREQQRPKYVNYVPD